MAITRRRFLGHGLAGVAALSAARGPATAQAQTAGRKALANRRRRIIFNDDGDDVWAEKAGTPEGFLNERLVHMLGTQADTLFYCTTQSFNYYTHRTKVAQTFVCKDSPYPNNHMQDLIDQGTDPLALAVEFAHKHNIEAVWTLRMNDIHDCFTPALWPEWKTQHPDALFGTRDDGSTPAGAQRRWWSGVDFAREDVRERTLEIIEEVAQNYDVDGIDLDWMRHPIHFRETWEGKPATAEHVDLLTRFMAQARELVMRVSDDRGRPILLSTRVPLTLKHGLHIGADTAAWLRGGLVDFITTGGGYVPFSMPVAEIASLAHPHGIPVYPCISNSGLIRRKPYGPGSVYAIEGWRAAAANAFANGAAGISIFNLFGVPGNDEVNQLVNQVFGECGDAATLSGKDKLFCIDNSEYLDGCGYTNSAVPYKANLPQDLPANTAVEFPLQVNDTVDASTRLSLRLQTDNDVALTATLGDADLDLAPAPELTDSFDLHWVVANVPPRCTRSGINRVRLTAKGAARLTNLELTVTHG
ncbi:MAG: hypothetical protein GY851_10405 [bacterium]|nr:hypothetical protein [bacterium]